MKITKTHFCLFLIVVLAFLTRLLFAYYTDIGTDEMIYSVMPHNIISTGKLSTVEQAPLYFYVADLGQRLSGGLTLFSTRLPAIFFGSFLVLVVFLTATELFGDKKAGIISALLYALSGYTLHSNKEMDTMAYFFALLSMFFFLVALRRKQHWLVYSALFLALATLVKPIVLLFVPAFLLAWFFSFHQRSSPGQQTNGKQQIASPENRLIYHSEGKIVINKKLLKIVLLSLAVMVLVVAPVLIYNYLLYNEKGITDYYFTVLTGLGKAEIYTGQESKGWSLARLASIGGEILTDLLREDALLFILGLSGILLAYRREQAGTSMLVLALLSLFIYLAGKTGSTSHYLWLPLILSVFAGYSSIKIKEYLEQLSIRRRRQSLPAFHRSSFSCYCFILLLLLALLNAALLLGKVVYVHQERSSSMAIVLNEYANEHIPPDSVIVFDPRIYRGIFAWALTNHHYLEGIYFHQLAPEINTGKTGEEVVPLYYIECGPGTYCGWKPEDFQRIDALGANLSTMFKERLTKVAELKAIDTFLIYRGEVALDPALYDAIDRTHTFWYTPVGWKFPKDAVDYYVPKTPFQRLLNLLGQLILYLEVLLALLSPLLLFFLLGRPSG